jgi:hypothetical protein
LEKLPQDRLSEEEKLSHIKEFYTMQTERDIHDKILNGAQGDHQSADDEEDGDEGDMELF